MRKDSLTRWISARSDPVPQKGSLFDGVSARAQEVLVEGIDASLRLHSAGWSDEVPISKLRSLARDAKRLRVGRSDVDGWSLVLDQPVADDLLALLPAEHFSNIRSGIGRKDQTPSGPIATAEANVASPTIEALQRRGIHLVGPTVGLRQPDRPGPELDRHLVRVAGCSVVQPGVDQGVRSPPRRTRPQSLPPRAAHGLSTGSAAKRQSRHGPADGGP